MRARRRRQWKKTRGDRGPAKSRAAVFVLRRGRGGRWQSVGGLYRVCDDGGMLRPGRILAGRGAAPLRRLRRHLPLQGRLWRSAAEGGGGRWLADAPAQGVRWPEGTARFCVVHYRAFLGEGSGRDGEIWNLLKRKKYGIIFGDYPNLKVGKNAYIINSINK